MNNENDSKWSAKMLITWAILIDIGLLGCLFIMPLLKLIQDLFQLIYLLIVSRRLFSSPGFFLSHVVIELNILFIVLILQRNERNFSSIVLHRAMNTNRSVNLGLEIKTRLQ